MEDFSIFYEIKKEKTEQERLTTYLNNIGIGDAKKVVSRCTETKFWVKIGLKTVEKSKKTLLWKFPAVMSGKQ